MRRVSRSGVLCGLRVTLCSAVTVLAACNGPAEKAPRGAQEMASSVAALVGAVDAVTGAADGLDVLLGKSTGEALSARLQASLLAGPFDSLPLLLLAEPPRNLIERLVPRGTVSELHRLQQDVRRVLAERLLVPENVESQLDSETIYLLRPEVSCRQLDGDALDPRCLRLLSAVEVRVRLTSATTSAAGFQRAFFLIGPDRINPFVVQTSPAALNLFVHLEWLKAASTVLSQALGEADPLPDRLAGEVRLSLVTADDRLELGVYLPRRVELVDDGDGESRGTDPLVLRVTSAHPLGRALLLMTEPGRLTVLASLGPAEVHTVWHPHTAQPPGPLRLLLSGLEGQLTFREAEGTFSASQVTLGPRPSVVEVRGAPVFEVMMNSNQRDAFDFTVRAEPGTAAGRTLRIRPRLDVQARWNLAAVAGDLLQPPPAYLLDDSYQLTIDAPREPAGGSALLESVERQPSEHQGGARVVQGELQLWSSVGPQLVTVGEGQCLLRRQPSSSPSSPLEAFEVRDCPVRVTSPE